MRLVIYTYKDVHPYAHQQPPRNVCRDLELVNIPLYATLPWTCLLPPVLIVKSGEDDIIICLRFTNSNR